MKTAEFRICIRTETKLVSPLGDFLNGLVPVIARLLPTILIAIATVVVIMVAVHFLRGPMGQWRKDRLGAGGFAAVSVGSRCAPRLTSLRRRERLRTAKLAGGDE